jgi:hypothetical protein
MTLPASISLSNQAFSLIGQNRYVDAADILMQALLLMKSEARSNGGIIDDTENNEKHIQQHQEHDTSDSALQNNPTADNVSDSKEDGIPTWKWDIPADGVQGEYVFQRPILLSKSSATEFPDRFFAITFNLALANHLEALRQEQVGDESKSFQLKMLAKQLYELTLQIEGFECVFGFHVAAAIFNNLSNIIRSISNEKEKEAEQYDLLLVSCLCYLSETSNNFAATEEYHGLFASASRVILKCHVAAAA